MTRAFGRRINPLAMQPTMAAESAPQKAAAAAVAAEASLISPPVSLPEDIAEPSLDDELEAWTKARRESFRLPWRQLSLMASLCFGIASLALPDSVDDAVRWLFYALTVAGLCGGLAKRRQTGH